VTLPYKNVSSQVLCAIRKRTILNSKYGGKKFMKIKSKLILAATSLLVLSGVAAGTSTFAWFTVNQLATVDVTSMTVNTNTDSLKMVVTPTESDIFVTNAGTDPDSSYEAVATSEGNLLTDVSGPGVQLFKGSTTTTTTTSVDEATSVTTTSTTTTLDGSTTVEEKAPNCFDFKIAFSNTNPDKAMAVFLSYTSTISPTADNDADKALANSMRVAILDSTSTASLAYYAPNESTTSQIVTGIDGAVSAGAATASDLGLETYSQNLLLNTYGADYNDASTSTTASAPGYLGTIPTGVDNNLIVVARIWLEGTDLDCSNTALEGNAAVNLIFNGVSNIVA